MPDQNFKPTISTEKPQGFTTLENQVFHRNEWGKRHEIVSRDYSSQVCTPSVKFMNSATVLGVKQDFAAK